MLESMNVNKATDFRAKNGKKTVNFHVLPVHDDSYSHAIHINNTSNRKAWILTTVIFLYNEADPSLHATQLSSAQLSSVPLYSTTEYSTAEYSTVQYDRVQYSTVLYRYSTVQYSSY